MIQILLERLCKLRTDLHNLASNTKTSDMFDIHVSTGINRLHGGIHELQELIKLTVDNVNHAYYITAKDHAGINYILHYEITEAEAYVLYAYHSTDTKYSNISMTFERPGHRHIDISNAYNDILSNIT